MTMRKSVMVALAGGTVLMAGFFAGEALAQRSRGPAAGARVRQTAPKDVPDGSDNRPIANFLREHFRGLASLKGKLGITQEQRETIRGLVKGHKDELVGLVKEVVSKRRALRDTVLADGASEESIRSAADALGSAIADAAVAASQVVADVKGVLTDDQKELIRQHRQGRDAAVDKLLDGVPTQ